MELRWAVIVFLVAILILWMKLRKRRPASVQRKHEAHNAKRVRVPLQKGISSCCLILDRRLFGESFSEKEPPKLPCCKNCKCTIEDVAFKSSDIFEREKQSDVQYPSDLGPLDFKAYKYYKYSLILYNKDLSEEEIQSFSEIRDMIEVPEEFSRRVADHLNNNEDSSSNESKRPAK